VEKVPKSFIKKTLTVQAKNCRVDLLRATKLAFPIKRFDGTNKIGMT
jgi:hypothetical protein